MSNSSQKKGQILKFGVAIIAIVMFAGVVGIVKPGHQHTIKGPKIVKPGHQS